MESPEMMPLRVMQMRSNSSHIEWVTPSYILDAVRRTFSPDGIDLDPASSDLAQTQVKARQYWTAKDDALTKPWEARNIWLNPPYSARTMTRFIDHLVMQYPNYDEACVITNSATETRWGQKLGRLSNAICLLNKRVIFLRVADDGESLYTPRHHSMQGQIVWYVGHSPEQFQEAFNHFGIVYRKPTAEG